MATVTVDVKPLVSAWSGMSRQALCLVSARGEQTDAELREAPVALSVAPVIVDLDPCLPFLSDDNTFYTRAT